MKSAEVLITPRRDRPFRVILTGCDVNILSQDSVDAIMRAARVFVRRHGYAPDQYSIRYRDIVPLPSGY